MKNYQRPKRPIILLGAARSGTKLLRSILGAHSHVRVVPYDINYVWTMGNYGLGHDELDPSLLDGDIRDFIGGFVGRFGEGGKVERIAEKTISNTLRVPFVEAVFPDSQYVVITRDGRDVAGSSREQWTARSSGSSLIEKMRTFPARHAWAYGIRYVDSYLAGCLPWRAGARTWGARFKGMEDFVQSHELIETCAMQWVKSIEGVRGGLEGIDPGRVHNLRYEELVSEPLLHVGQVLDFLELDFENSVQEYCQNWVSSANLGKWRTQIDSREMDLIRGILNPTLAMAGYDSD